MKLKEISSYYKPGRTLPWVRGPIPPSVKSSRFPWKIVELEKADEEKIFIRTHYFCTICNKYTNEKKFHIPSNLKRLLVGCTRCNTVGFAVSGFREEDEWKMWEPQ
jgi:hypothetical protein